MKTEIKRTSTIVNGKHINVYHSRVTSWDFRFRKIGYRMPAIRMLEELDPKVYWMSDEEFTKYIGYLPHNSLERAQKIIDLLLEQVRKIDEQRDLAKQAKLTKQVSYITYP